MKPQRKATPVQRVMVTLLGIALGAGLLFLIPEIAGIVDPATEDTFTEWVIDLPAFAFWMIVVLSTIAGLILAWFGLHYIEHRVRRWRNR